MRRVARCSNFSPSLLQVPLNGTKKRSCFEEKAISVVDFSLFFSFCFLKQRRVERIDRMTLSRRKCVTCPWATLEISSVKVAPQTSLPILKSNGAGHASNSTPPSGDASNGSLQISFCFSLPALSLSLAFSLFRCCSSSVPEARA